MKTEAILRRNQNRKNEVEIQGLAVEVRNGDVGKALRRFKKMVQEDGILQEVRGREFYEKPSIVKNRKKKQARNRHLKALAKRKRDLGY